MTTHHVYPVVLVHPDLVTSDYHSTDNTRDSAPITTPPQLSSRMKHIKQEMAKNHLQFVCFEATDLHGVSRSKSIPAQFFQVSFPVMRSVISWPVASKHSLWLICVSCNLHSNLSWKAIICFAVFLVPPHITAPQGDEHTIAIPISNRNRKLIKAGYFSASALNNFTLQNSLFFSFCNYKDYILFDMRRL